MDQVVQRIINEIKQIGVLSYKGPGLVRLGVGHFSSVYAHPSEQDKVIKITINEVANDGFPLFVDYVKNKPGYSIYPVVHYMIETEDRNGHPFNVSVCERLMAYYDLDIEDQEQVKYVYGALIRLDNEFLIDAAESPELINKQFERFKASIPHNWENLSQVQRIELREAHDMLYTLCSEWEPNWGMMPDIGSSNVMVRKTTEGRYECVINDPIACGDIFHERDVDYDEFMSY